jgi:hypothetical protein
MFLLREPACMPIVQTSTFPPASRLRDSVANVHLRDPVCSFVVNVLPSYQRTRGPWPEPRHKLQQVTTSYSKSQRVSARYKSFHIQDQISVLSLEARAAKESRSPSPDILVVLSSTPDERTGDISRHILSSTPDERTGDISRHVFSSTPECLLETFEESASLGG